MSRPQCSGNPFSGKQQSITDDTVLSVKVAIAGAHGSIARLLGALLTERGDSSLGIIRNPNQANDLKTIGVEPVLVDLEQTTVAELADAISGCDALVFAAGAGPGSGIPRKETVDHEAADKCTQAAEQAGVPRLIQISSIGAGNPPEDDSVFSHYLRAKAAAEETLRKSNVSWVILRPGHLTDEPATGLINLTQQVPGESVPRADVAAVIAGLLDRPSIKQCTLELVSGSVARDERLDELADS